MLGLLPINDVGQLPTRAAGRKADTPRETGIDVRPAPNCRSMHAKARRENNVREVDVTHRQDLQSDDIEGLSCSSDTVVGIFSWEILPIVGTAQIVKRFSIFPYLDDGFVAAGNEAQEAETFGDGVAGAQPVVSI